ncbi:ABC transporter substrate-binding protein [Mucisphaera calidilacus]|uniref:Glycerol-3-phosphate transporter periplasmic binding protein n=1 Tax=Mucisphaera calidilacus TaxID=2527982 RepID=A0A518BVA7_9BACT|nr:ABC transporter substrate-binding protein [Mucisphaera calidilacus]QDU70909.1 glycerol-3-phosphate transporter periplasmic binding protein [Mucisphaera calidilacus]
MTDTRPAARPFRLLLTTLVIGLVLSATGGCSDRRDDRTADGRVIVSYWEKWTSFEGEAMRRVVDDFNASQDRIFVKMLTVSQIDQKLMLATAGGNPPDVAGGWSYLSPSYAEKNALTPLDTYIEEYGIRKEDYYPAVWRALGHQGIQWGLPSTPATVALHWNKQMFREAGLDPDRPPQSIAELDAMAEKLTIVELERDGETVLARYADMTEQEKADMADDRNSARFKIIQLGHSPNYPGWWKELWGYWWGSSLIRDERYVNIQSEENLEALRWMDSYTAKYGAKNMDVFGSSFGNFSSPQNPFLEGRIAMVLQGVWLYNFIEKYSPRMDWGAAPFPSADPERLPGVTIMECDVLWIPKGARHPDEAFEFIAFVNQQQNIEKLCLGQRKFSPLIQTSERFITDHPNPNIQVFIDLAGSPNAKTVPQTPVWVEYKDELINNIDSVFRQTMEPERAAEIIQSRVQRKFDASFRRWDRTRDALMAQWRQNP